MSAESLAEALRALGIEGAVEAHGRLAVLVPRADVAMFEGDAVRRAVLALSAEHGFTHLALELDDDGDGAAVPRD